jgi:hypothetical protein
MADNILAFGFNTNAVDDATTILGDPASAFYGDTGAGTPEGGTVPLEDQLQTSPAGGTPEPLDERGFIAANAVLEAGMLVVGGGRVSTPGLTIGNGCTLTGFGIITGPLTNQGAVIASGGTRGSLDLPIGRPAV